MAFSTGKLSNLCQRIHCAICNKPVDRVYQEWFYDADMLRIGVECHGDMDFCDVTSQFLADLPEMGKVTVRAFTGKRLIVLPARLHEADTQGETNLHGDWPMLKLLAPSSP